MKELFAVSGGGEDERADQKHSRLEQPGAHAMLGASTILSLSPLVFLGAAGLAVLLYGIRGRREGDVPHCRKCAYNLTGLTSERCPECGSSIAPVGIICGDYRPRWFPLIISVLPLLVCAWMLGNLTYQHARMFNPYRYYPFDWLVNKLHRGDGLCFFELNRRDWNGTLSAAQTNAFIEMALAEQDKSSTPINRRTWLELLGRWDKSEILTPDQRARFHSQLEALVIPTIRQPLKAYSGDRLTVTLVYELVVAFPVWRTSFAFSVDGQPLAVSRGDPRDERPESIEWIDQPNTYQGPVIDLPQGRHQLEYRARYNLFRPGERPTWPLRRGENSHVLDHSEALVSKEIVVTADLEVLPPFDSARIKLIHDPAMAKLIKQAVSIWYLHAYQESRAPPASRLRKLANQALGLEPIWPSDFAKVGFGCELYRPLPLHVAFDVLLRLPDRDVYVGTVAWPKSMEVKHSSSRELKVAVPRLEARHAFVVLRANPEAARPFAEIDRIWDGELVLGPEYIRWRER